MTTNPTWQGKRPGTAVGCPACGATVRVGDAACGRCYAVLPTPAEVAAATVAGPKPCRQLIVVLAGIATLCVLTAAAVVGLVIILSSPSAPRAEQTRQRFLDVSQGVWPNRAPDTMCLHLQWAATSPWTG